MKKILSVGLLISTSFTASAGLQTVDLSSANAGAYSVSRNADYLVFSTSNSLLPEDTDQTTDIYRKNLSTGAIDLVTKKPDGSQIDIVENDTMFPSISNDGRYITFTTAHSIAANDTATRDVYLKDMQTGAIEWLTESRQNYNAAYAGEHAYMTSDGRYVAFYASGNVSATGGSEKRSYRLDRNTNTLTTVVVGGLGGISDDGRYVLTKLSGQVYVYDMQTSTSELISKNSSGTASNSSTYYSAISANGRFVTFSSLATDLVAGDTNNLIDQFMYDRSTGVMTRVSTRSDGSEFTSLGIAFSPSVTEDGNKVYLAIKDNVVDSNNTNNTYQLYVKNITDNSLTAISVSDFGDLANTDVSLPVVSSKLDVVYFVSQATNLNPDNGIKSNVYVADFSLSACLRN